MEKYVKEVFISTEHLNAKNELSCSSILKLIQEIAGEHATKFGMGREEMLKRNLIWIIGKTSVEINRLPGYGENIICETWPMPPKLFLFPRVLLAKDQKGNVLFNSTSIWTLVDVANHKFADLNQYELGYEGLVTGEEIECPSSLRFEGLDKKITLTPTFRDIDLNGHVNNTKYLDLLEDLIPLDYLMSHSPKEISIHYKREMKLGESSELSYGLIGDAYCFKCDRFECRITYKARN